MEVTVEKIVEVTGGRVLQKGQSIFSSYAIDSRKVQPGGLFFALRGSVTDGHLFVQSAAHCKAAGAVVEKPVAVPPDLTLIEVSDSLKALQKLAATVRAESEARFVGITGSAGKTSTKEFTAALLSRKFRVYKSEGNLNSITGLPLSLLAMDQPEYAVFEVGMSEPGEIAALANLLQPHVRVMLNVNPVHLQQFPSIEAIADEKASLLSNTRTDDSIVYNIDDPRICERVKAFPRSQLVSFGFRKEADLRIEVIRSLGVNGQQAGFWWKDIPYAFLTSLCGKGNLYNIAAAACVALLSDIHPETIAVSIGALRPYSQRGILIPAAGFDIYDDSYNSNPAALKFTLDLAAQSDGYSRKVAVLGDMLELGSGEAEFHAEAGKYAASLRFDLLIAVGPRSAYLAEAARKSGLPDVVEALDSQQAAELACSAVRAGDLVLVKGSRGMKMEVVVESLRKK